MCAPSDTCMCSSNPVRVLGIYVHALGTQVHALGIIMYAHGILQCPSDTWTCSRYTRVLGILVQCPGGGLCHGVLMLPGPYLPVTLADLMALPCSQAVSIHGQKMLLT